jgi:integrase
MHEQGKSPLDADEDDLDLFFLTLKHLAPKTQNSIHGILTSYFRRLANRQKTTWSPMSDRKRPVDEPLTPTPALTKSQAQLLLDSIGDDIGHPDRDLIARRDYALVALMLFTCMRSGEASDVRWKGISPTEGALTVSFIGKGRKPETVGLPEPVFRAMCMFKEAYEAKSGASLLPDDPIFLGVDYEGLARARARKNKAPLASLSERSISRIVADRISDLEFNVVAGMPAARFAAHCLRATGATLALEGGADLLDIQILMRHVQLETTRLYIRNLERRRTKVSGLIGLSLRDLDEEADEEIDGASLNGTSAVLEGDDQPASFAAEPAKTGSNELPVNSQEPTQPSVTDAA